MSMATKDLITPYTISQRDFIFKKTLQYLKQEQKKKKKKKFAELLRLKTGQHSLFEIIRKN